MSTGVSTSAAVFPLDGPLGTVLRALKGVKRTTGGGWLAKCPAHNDGRPSLLVSEGRDGDVLLHCYAGCTFDDIARATGLARKDFFASRTAGGEPAVHPRAYRIGGEEPPIAAGGEPAERGGDPTPDVAYPYVDEQGTLLYEVLRFVEEGGKKSFRQRRPDGEGWSYRLGDVRRVPYRLPELIEAIALGKRVFVVEGEKDVETLRGLGLVATTTAGGSGGWRPECAAAFGDAADVVILPDNDLPGEKYAHAVERDLLAVGAKVRVVRLPGLDEKEDITDWLTRHGHTAAELLALVEPPKRYRTLRELLADTDAMREPEPVVPNLAWRGRTTLLTGREKTSGKSTLCGAVAAAVSRGQPWLDETCAHGRVLLVGLEEAQGDTARRLVSFGADEDRIIVVDRFWRPPGQRIEELRSLIDETAPDLVVIDSLARFMDGLVEDTNKDAQTGPVAQGLTDLAHERSAGLLVIHHANKSGGSRGSTAIAAGFDVTAELHIPGEYEKDGPPDLYLRTITVRGRVTSLRIVSCRYEPDVPAYRLPGLMLSVEQRVLSYLRSHPGASGNQLAAAVGGRKQTVVDTTLELIANGYVEREGIEDGHSYRLTLAGERRR